MAIWLGRLLFAALALVGTAAGAEEPVNLPVAIPAVTPAATTFVVARDRGYYRDEGLDVKLIVMGSATGTQALIGGNVKFTTVGGAGLLPILRGAPLRFLFAAFNRPMFWLYARPDMRSIKDLRGKRVGVSSLGSGPDSLLRDLLVKQGLDGGRDVTIMAMGSGTGRFYALKAGAVDAAMLSIPSNFMAHDAGFRQLVSFIDQEWVELQGSIVAAEQTLSAEPLLAEKFVRASLKGLLYARGKRGETIAILARFLREREEEATKIYDVVWPGMTADGTVGPDLQRRSFEHIAARIALKEPPNPEKIFDFSIAARARRELNAQGWRP